MLSAWTILANKGRKSNQGDFKDKFAYNLVAKFINERV